MGFGGILNDRTGSVDFGVLRRACAPYKSGCAFVNREYGILCNDTSQPVILKHNNSIYTAALISDTHGEDDALTAQSVLEGYIEDGEGFLYGLDFPFSLALYDGRCAELLLIKNERGDKPLFYSESDGVLCFSTSVGALLNMLGGCVRVRKNVLKAHIMGGYSALPDGLFCDVRPLRSGQRLLCSRLGHSLVEAPNKDSGQTQHGIPALAESLKISASGVREKLTSALFAFGYPQFDHTMPALLEYARKSRARGERSAAFYDVLENTEYARERNARIGEAEGIMLSSVAAERADVNKRVMKAIEREIDNILAKYLDTPTNIIRSFADGELLEIIENEKSTPLRIRSKGMLCQTAMWFESCNLIIV